MFTFTAGEAMLIQLGKPTSTLGHDVQVEVNPQRMNFIDFDEGSMTLSVREGITSNEDTGIYTLVVKLSEQKDGLSKEYKIKVTLVAASEAVECSEQEQKVCHTEEIDGQEVEACECETLCPSGETMICQQQVDDAKEREDCQCEADGTVQLECTEGEELVCEQTEEDG